MWADLDGVVMAVPFIADADSIPRVFIRERRDPRVPSAVAAVHVHVDVE